MKNWILTFIYLKSLCALYSLNSSGMQLEKLDFFVSGVATWLLF